MLSRAYGDRAQITGFVAHFSEKDEHKPAS